MRHCFIAIATVTAALLLGVAPQGLTQNRNGILKVTSKPTGASVYVLGKTYGPTPVLIELPMGKHRITITRDGFPPATRTVSINTGEVTNLAQRFTNAPRRRQIRVHDTRVGGTDAGPGTVMINTRPPGLTVFMNDLIVPQPTPVAFDLRAGVYEMRIEDEGEIVYRRTVFVRAGRTKDLDIVIKRRRRIDASDPWK